MAKKKRVRAREIALQALYQYDISQKGTKDVLSGEDLAPFVAQSTQDMGVREYAQRVVDGCLSCLDELDNRIAKAATHWKLDRIAPVDRSIMRLALYELLRVDEVPPRVAINEAIELAKKFSTAQSGSFVNGVLDRLYHDHVDDAPENDAPRDQSEISTKPKPDADQDTQ